MWLEVLWVGMGYGRMGEANTLPRWDPKRRWRAWRNGEHSRVAFRETPMLGCQALETNGLEDDRLGLIKPICRGIGRFRKDRVFRSVVCMSTCFCGSMKQGVGQCSSWASATVAATTYLYVKSHIPVGAHASPTSPGAVPECIPAQPVALPDPSWAACKNR